MKSIFVAALVITTAALSAAGVAVAYVLGYLSAVTYTFGLLGGVLASIASVLITDDYRSERAKKDSLKNTQIDILFEMQQNSQHQKTSFMIPLEDEAYRRLRQTGLVLELDVREQNMLRELYSYIHNKNGLVAIYLAKGDVEIAGGEKSENIRVVIDKLRDNIDRLHSELIILFQDKLKIRRS